MNEDTHIWWNGLAQFCVTPKKTDAILTYFETPENALTASGKDWADFYSLAEMFGFTEEEKTRIAACCKRDHKEAYERLIKNGFGFVIQEDEEYPDKMKKIFSAPRFFYYKGKLPGEKTIAIIGARNCSGYGSRMAFRIAKELAESGIGIISGLAYGVDRAAHDGALAGKGRTYGILGCGIDVCYPKCHQAVYDKMCETGGGIISEYPPGTQPLSCFFPQRNRIIAALSDGILVTEAREKSGTLITVSFGLEYGKAIYAVPGRADDVLSEGCIRLLKEGAKPVVKAEDILEDIIEYPGRKRKVKKKSVVLSDMEQNVLGCLKFHPKHIEFLLGETGLEYAVLLTALEELQTKGLIARHGQGYYETL